MDVVGTVACALVLGTTGTTVESVEAGRRRWTRLEEVHTPPLLGRIRKVE
jgi:hypothetical protein